MGGQKSDDELIEALREANKNDSVNWHVIAKSKYGEFQWIVDNDGNIIDCPYFLRGYWIGRLVDMQKLLRDPPEIIVTCSLSGHIDQVRFDDFDVVATKETTLSTYAYDGPYLGGLYDLRQK